MKEEEETNVAIVDQPCQIYLEISLHHHVVESLVNRDLVTVFLDGGCTEEKFKKRIRNRSS